jgi:hypothetical protein
LALAFLAAPFFLVGCSGGGGTKDSGADGANTAIGEDGGSLGDALADAYHPDALPFSDTPAQGDASPSGRNDVGVDGALTDAAQPDVPLPSDKPAQDGGSLPDAADARPDSGDASSGGDSAPDGPPAIETPQTIPARQKVTFRVTNGTSAPQYLGVEGIYCAPFAINQGATNLDMAIGYQCGCECPPPPGPAIAKYWVISPQQTKDLIWDARALEIYAAYSRSCATSWGMPSTSVSIMGGVWQPVGPGAYTVTLTLDSAVRTSCTTAEDVVSCQWPSYGGSGGSGGQICPSGATVTASFDLPETGDIVVPVTI